MRQDRVQFGINLRCRTRHSIVGGFIRPPTAAPAFRMRGLAAAWRTCHREAPASQAVADPERRKMRGIEYLPSGSNRRRRAWRRPETGSCPLSRPPRRRFSGASRWCLRSPEGRRRRAAWLRSPHHAYRHGLCKPHRRRLKPGLMQLVPIAARFGVADARDPVQNIRDGVACLDWLVGAFGGDPIPACPSYNAGGYGAAAWARRPVRKRGSTYRRCLPHGTWPGFRAARRPRCRAAAATSTCRGPTARRPASPR